MKCLIILFTLFTFSNITYAQDGPLEGTKEKMELEKEIDKKSGNKVIKLRTSKTHSARPEPLWIIEGIKVNSSEISNIDPEKIKSVSVFKSEKANALYGEDGKNGVIIITLKKRFRKKFRKMMSKR